MKKFSYYFDIVMTSVIIGTIVGIISGSIVSLLFEALIKIDMPQIELTVISVLICFIVTIPKVKRFKDEA